jgi:phosphatidylinositol alpha-1,6-mannosyltransferase
MDFYPNKGGIAVFIRDLCIQLAGLGHKVDILAKKNSNTYSFDKSQQYNVYRCKLYRRLSSIGPILKTLLLYNRKHYDIILIGQFMTTHAIGILLLKKILGVPYVILSHGNDLHYRISTWCDKIIARYLIENANLMLGNSHFVGKRILEMCYNKTTEILNPGVDCKKFHPGVNVSEIQERYGLKGNKVLLTTARLVPKKNIDNILRSLVIVVKKIPNILYLIVGDGEQKNYLKELSVNLEIQKNVCFIGNIENDILPVFYCVSDIYVMPSCKIKSTNDIETFGISFVEASACGKPVIGSRIGGIEDAVIDGETGLLVDPYNIEEIANAIIRLLTDRELSARLGVNGRKRVEEKFDWQIVGKKLERYLNKIEK